jgi:hypothetical protein
MLRFNHGVSQKAATISTIFGKKRGASVPSGFSAVTGAYRVPSQPPGKYDGPQSFVRAVGGTPRRRATRLTLQSSLNPRGKSGRFLREKANSQRLATTCAAEIRKVWPEGHELGKTEASRDCAI